MKIPLKRLAPALALLVIVILGIALAPRAPAIPSKSFICTSACANPQPLSSYGVARVFTSKTFGNTTLQFTININGTLGPIYIEQVQVKLLPSPGTNPSSIILTLVKWLADGVEQGQGTPISIGGAAGCCWGEIIPNLPTSDLVIDPVDNPAVAATGNVVPVSAQFVLRFSGPVCPTQLCPPTFSGQITVLATVSAPMPAQGSTVTVTIS